MQTISNTSYPSSLKKKSVHNILFSFFCHGKKVQKVQQHKIVDIFLKEINTIHRVLSFNKDNIKKQIYTKVSIKQRMIKRFLKRNKNKQEKKSANDHHFIKLCVNV